MDGDESMLSFFDEQDFDFAREEHNADATSEKSTKLNVILFTDQISEDGEVAGIVTVRVHKSLKAGSFFLRVDTIEELTLNQTSADEPLTPLLHRLRPEKPHYSPILGRSRKEADEDKSQLMSAPVTARDLISHRDTHPAEPRLPASKSSKKLASVFPLASKRLRDLSCYVYYLSPEKTTQPRQTTTVEKMIFDVEIFTLDSEASKSPILIIPFRFELRGNLLKTCSVNIDLRTYVALSREKKRAARIITEKILEKNNEVKNSSEKPIVADASLLQRNQTINNSQHISLKHFLTCYYAPKAELLAYNKQPWDEPKKTSHRKKHFQNLPSAMYGSRELMIFPNFRTLDYKTHERKGQAYLTQEDPYFLCCTKKLNLEVSICVDLINLRNQDTTLNFVMRLDKQLLNDFPFLDVVVYSRLTSKYTKAESGGAEQQRVSHFVNLVDSFDLIERLPPSYKEKMIEFVHELNVAPLVGRQQTVNSFNAKMDFFAGFYLSSVAQRFEQELMKIPLSFWKVGKDAKFLDRSANSLKFDKLGSNVDGFNKEEFNKRGESSNTPCIILPRAVFDLSADIDKETGAIKTEHLKDQDLD